MLKSHLIFGSSTHLCGFLGILQSMADPHNNRCGAVFYIGEGEALTQLSRRTGSTLGETIGDIAHAQSTGAITPDPLDGHALLIRCRIAVILALWDGRNMVSRDDWEIAELIWKTSCEVREFIIDRAHEIASDEIADDAAAGAQRAAAAHVARSQADARVEMLAKRIARKVHATGW